MELEFRSCSPSRFGTESSKRNSYAVGFGVFRVLDLNFEL